MLQSQLAFYVLAVGGGLLGTAISNLLGWGESAQFLAGMIPLCAVLLVFILRESADGQEPQAELRNRSHPAPK